MKNFKYIIIALLFMGCNSKSEKTTSEKETVRQDKEWLNLEGKNDMPHIVLVSGDEEYRSEESLPQLAKILSMHHGFNCTVLFAQDPREPGIVDPNFVNNIPGLHHLQSADMMIIFTRFRALPDEQMKYIDDFLKSGKPVLGMRTSTHAFNFGDKDSLSHYQHYGNYYAEEDQWKDGFGRLVMGEKWISHHGHHGNQSTKGIVAPSAEDHPILKGIAEGEIWGPTDVYEVRLPLPGDSQPIVLGQVIDREAERDDKDPCLGMKSTDQLLPGLVSKKDGQGNKIKVNQNDPMMPVAWTKTYQISDGKSGKCFSTTMGASTDLLSEGTRRMIVNGVFWCLEIEVPDEANVDLVGEYRPSRFAFYADEYWEKKNMSVTDLY